ncbi:arginase family protein [Synechococcus sp. W70.1]|jgi:agmatinase|uniref:arginase family protein n=1 Tax=unclassified Synechococcus TaxID=2626047 RepID=UPI0039C0CB29
MAQWSLHPCSQSSARVLLIPTAFGPDTQAPLTILNAGAELCAFEPRLGIDVDQLAVAQLPGLMDEPPYGLCEAAVTQAWRRQQWPVLLPSVLAASWGAIRALWKHYLSLSVVHCSAHANFMPPIEMTQPDQDMSYGNGAWVELLYQHGLPVVHVGLRSSSARAYAWLRDHHSPIFWAQEAWDPQQVVEALPEQPVFLVVDCSVLDPSLAPAVHHPEPGGLSWFRLLQTCEAIFAARPVVGVSLGGVAVSSATRPTARIAARLLNWLLACYGLYSLKLDPNPASLERLENESGI